MQIRFNARTTALLAAVAVTSGSAALWRSANVAPVTSAVHSATAPATKSSDLPASALAGLDPMQQRLLKNLARQGKAGGVDVCYAPGTSPEYVARMERALHPNLGKVAKFQVGTGWTATATNGGGLVRGTATTITWSIVPDGTVIPGSAGEAATASSVIAFLNGLYTNQATWQPLIQQVFDRWSSISGLTYNFEPNDDGGTFPNGATGAAGVPGVLGVRGDVRISGHVIDGASGILAYNFFPNVGDMVLDTGDNAVYGNPTNGSRAFRNIIAHEHGHGLAFEHSCPVDQTKLMEPFLATAFDGPQLDDILAAQRLYGDAREKTTAGNNDSTTTASDLGILPTSPSQFTQLSLDGANDIDFYRFTSSAPNLSISVTLRPTGRTYLSGPQDDPADPAGCSAGTPYNSLAIRDLDLALIAPNGTTVFVNANSQPIGQPETISNFVLPGSGPFFLRVNSGALDDIQAYDLDVNLAVTGGPTPTPAPTPTATPAPTPTPLPGGNGDIVFVSTRDGNRELYAMTETGTNVRRLTTNSAIDDQPNVSRGGNRITFVSTRNGNNEIYTMNGDGTNVVRVTNSIYSDEQPQFSPDSSRIVFVSNRNGNNEIYVMNANGTGQTRLTAKVQPDEHPSFSPDGSKIVFSSRRSGNDEIYIMNADGTNVVRLTNSAQIDTRPNFSRDGQKIIFQSSVTATNYEIYVMNVDGTNPTRLTFATAADVVPCFSRDGTMIAFAATRGGGDNEICVNGLSSEKTSPVRVITTNSLDDFWPSWGLLPGVGLIETPKLSTMQSRDAASREAASSLVADAKRELLLINFTGALDAAAVAGATYQVTINGETVEVDSAALMGGSTVSLLLPEGALRAGDSVSVTCLRLRDEGGALLSPTPLTAVAR